jgi:hypothetical protein
MIWSRLKFVALLCATIGYVPDLIFGHGRPWFLYRALIIGVAAMLAFGLFERWPAHLPKALARWVLQVLGVAAVIPLTTLAIWTLTTDPGAAPFWADKDRLMEFSFATVVGLLIAPWTALGALLRQKEAFVRHQALAFDLERSELERQASEARLHLLQAQVAPHFLFNTLANIQALVQAGSPRAAEVLRSLVNYLRAAVPRLNDSGTTLGQEVQLAQAYLELMHMRMPDRLSFAVKIDERAKELPCPPMTVMTLVENAVRHGIDPSEEGGRIEISVEPGLVRVCDTGIGFREGTGGLGTGLSSLRERLRGRAELRLSEQEPHGVVAEVEFIP